MIRKGEHMSPWILKGILMVADVQVQMPQENPEAVVRQAETGKDDKGKANCYPWFKENNYKCPSPKDQK
jgi:hypothetical protein